MLELTVLLLLITVAFGWTFMAGVTERKTGHKNYWFWPFVLTYWYGKGRPKSTTETTSAPVSPSKSSELSESMKNLNDSILLLIQKLEERQKATTKKTTVKEPEKTNQGG